MSGAASCHGRLGGEDRHVGRAVLLDHGQRHGAFGRVLVGCAGLRHHDLDRGDGAHDGIGVARGHAGGDGALDGPRSRSTPGWASGCSLKNSSGQPLPGSDRKRDPSHPDPDTERPGRCGVKSPASAADATRVIQPCGSGAVPCWMPSSASRTFIVTAPGSPSVTRNEPCACLTSPTGVTTAAVPQANTSLIVPSAQPCSHSSVEITPLLDRVEPHVARPASGSSRG